MRAHSHLPPRTSHLLIVFSFVGLSTPLQAQSLADRVASVGNDVVTFHFTARPGVCGDGEHFIRTGRNSYHGSFSDGRPTAPCIAGPVQVRLTVNDGAVSRVQSWVGPLRDREARELGVVSAPEAARYLMTIAQRGNHSASAKAIFPAVLADSATVWPALLQIARDEETRSRATRQEATLWLSLFASAAVSGHPGDPFFDDDDGDADEDLKSHAVFVLSQLPNGRGVPSLLEVARSNPSRRVRSKALFWLGQSGDPRAIALFESVLRS
jgi:HEAT repeat protein